MRERDAEEEKRETSPEIPPEDDDPTVCGKAFSAEIARSQDEDGPCDDGAG